MPSSSQSTLLDSATETHLAEPRYGGFGLWSVGPGFIVGLNIVVLALPNGYPYIVAQYPPPTGFVSESAASSFLRPAWAVCTW